MVVSVFCALELFFTVKKVTNIITRSAIVRSEHSRGLKGSFMKIWGCGRQVFYLKLPSFCFFFCPILGIPYLSKRRLFSLCIIIIHFSKSISWVLVDICRLRSLVFVSFICPPICDARGVAVRMAAHSGQRFLCFFKPPTRFRSSMILCISFSQHKANKIHVKEKYTFFPFSARPYVNNSK